jgi:hypothetical protein
LPLLPAAQRLLGLDNTARRGGASVRPSSRGLTARVSHGAAELSVGARRGHQVRARSNDVSITMEPAQGSGSQVTERRRGRRVWVPAVAVLQSGGQPPSVWRVTNLASGGAALVGDGVLLSGRLSMSLHVAGYPDLELAATLTRRQLSMRAGRCAVRFVDLSEEQRRALREMLGGDHTPGPERRRAFLVHAAEPRAGALAADLAALGFAVRSERSPGQAAAWLQRETADVLLVDRRVVETDRWNLLEFARGTAPEMRRFVLSEDVRGFRLYFALKAGLVDGLVEPTTPRDKLARQLLGAPGGGRPGGGRPGGGRSGGGQRSAAR